MAPETRAALKKRERTKAAPIAKLPSELLYAVFMHAMSYPAPLPIPVAADEQWKDDQSSASSAYHLDCIFQNLRWEMNAADPTSNILEHPSVTHHRRWPWSMYRPKTTMSCISETCRSWNSVLAPFRDLVLSVNMPSSRLPRTSKYLRMLELAPHDFSPTSVPPVVVALLQAHRHTLSALALNHHTVHLFRPVSTVLSESFAQLQDLDVSTDFGPINVGVDEDFYSCLAACVNLKQVSIRSLGSQVDGLRVLSLLASLTRLVEVRLAAHGASEARCTPVQFQSVLRKLELRELPGLSLPDAVELGSHSAGTLERLAITEGDTEHAVPIAYAPLPQPPSYPNLRYLDLNANGCQLAWTEMPHVAAVIENSPRLASLALWCINFVPTQPAPSTATATADGEKQSNTHTNTAPLSPAERLKLKVGNGTVKRLTLSGNRAVQPEELLSVEHSPPLSWTTHKVQAWFDWE